MIVLIRHGPTRWNEEGRMQGRADLPLSAAGRAQVASWRLPASWADARWLSSPLRRAIDTAARLTDRPVSVEPRLIEMDWGAWEGRTLADLRAETPRAMAANEARGLDFRPPGGESPREVRARLAGLFAELADDVVCVTHKGVIRAALSLATGWDMLSKPPLRLGDDTALILSHDDTGRLEFQVALIRLIG
ncbi:MAG: histidine phosphatase family protein [Geminicoccales bacterium]